MFFVIVTFLYAISLFTSSGVLNVGTTDLNASFAIRSSPVSQAFLSTSIFLYISSLLNAVSLSIKIRLLSVLSNSSVLTSVC